MNHDLVEDIKTNKYKTFKSQSTIKEYFDLDVDDSRFKKLAYFFKKYTWEKEGKKVTTQL